MDLQALNNQQRCHSEGSPVDFQDGAEEFIPRHERLLCWRG